MVSNFLDIVAHTVVLHLTSKSTNNAVREKMSYVKNRAYRVGSHIVSILSIGIDGISQWNRFLTTKNLCLAEVVGSSPTLPIFINLVIYGIRLSSFTTFLNPQ